MFWGLVHVRETRQKNPKKEKKKRTRVPYITCASGKAECALVNKPKKEQSGLPARKCAYQRQPSFLYSAADFLVSKCGVTSQLYQRWGWGKNFTAT